MARGGAERGSAPQTRACVRSTCLTSSAESSFLIWPPVQSVKSGRATGSRGEAQETHSGAPRLSSPIVSTRKTSPSATVAVGGMSGCQRLCTGGSCSHGSFFGFTARSVLGISKRVERWLCATHNWGGYIVRASFFYLDHQELARAAEAAYLRSFFTAFSVTPSRVCRRCLHTFVGDGPTNVPLLVSLVHPSTPIVPLIARPQSRRIEKATGFATYKTNAYPHTHTEKSGNKEF